MLFIIFRVEKKVLSCRSDQKGRTLQQRYIILFFWSTGFFFSVCLLVDQVDVLNMLLCSMNAPISRIHSKFSPVSLQLLVFK